MFSIYRFGIDDSKQIQNYIDKHSHSVYEGPTGYGGVHYKDVLISNSEIKGIGYWDEYFCLYSQNVITKFIYGVGHVPFVIRCEILFEWEDYGT